MAEHRTVDADVAGSTPVSRPGQYRLVNISRYFFIKIVRSSFTATSAHYGGSNEIEICPGVLIVDDFNPFSM